MNAETSARGEAHFVAGTLPADHNVAGHVDGQRGLQQAQRGVTACHVAAMLFFIHGKAPSALDMGQREFFLLFNTDDMAERARAVRELRAAIGVDPDAGP